VVQVSGVATLLWMARDTGGGAEGEGALQPAPPDPECQVVVSRAFEVPPRVSRAPRPARVRSMAALHRRRTQRLQRQVMARLTGMDPELVGRVRAPAPHTHTLVLIGHAASLTPY